MKKEFTPLTKAIATLTVVFVITNMLVLVFSSRLQDKGVDTNVVVLGNLFLFLISGLSIWMYGKSGNPQRPQGIIRNVYGGFMLKFFALIVGVMVYFYFAREINKPAIFICMALYLVYNFAGVLQVVKKGTPRNDRGETHPPKHATHHHHK